jgi:hypothetical protein
MRTFKLLFILFVGFSSCEKYNYTEQNYTEQSDSDEKFVPTDVIVKTKGYYTIDNVFNFINSFDHEVEYIKYGFYTSSLQSDSLQYILDFLNAKSYTHDGNAWYVTGYLHYRTKIISIFPKLFNIKNKANQYDWLQSMKILKLTEQTDNVTSGNVIYFHVPEGQEKEWVIKFKDYSFVEWAELNYIVQLNPWP